jgi:peptidoglycan/LPS O-acetylase OafA/YrhL
MNASRPSFVTTAIPSLDGLRALSFLIVFVAHAGLGAYVPGGFGVTVFFFLSGFLITTLMRIEYKRHGEVNLKHFWLRRILRIWPPFYLVLFTGVAAEIIYQPGMLSISATRAQLLHLSNYWSIRHGFDGQADGTGVYWSLAVEEHFYLAFPWLYVGMQRAKLNQRQQGLLLWALCAAVLLWRLILVEAYHVPADRTYMGTDTRIDSILFGCALAIWGNPVLDAPIWKDATVKYRLLPAALLVLAGCIVIRSDAFRETLRYSMQGIALTAVFISAIQFHQWGLFRLLNCRVAMFIGTLSYSLYLIHQTVLFKMERILNGLPVTQAVLSLGIAILIAWLIKRLIEMPCAQMRKQLK